MRQPAPNEPAKKLIQLEAARGIASIIVIFHHFARGFLPLLKESVRFTPAFIVFNGDGAVCFFFMLSGFVLTQGMYRKFTTIGLTRAVIKRLPRLMVPASITIFAGWAIFVFEPHFYVQAASLSNSDWLSDFAYAQFPAGLIPTFRSAIKQCLLVFVAPKSFFYNSNLWTMRTEFYGSLLVFMLAAVSSAGALAFPRRVMILHSIVVLLLAASGKLAFAAFPVGSGLVYCYTNAGSTLEISRRCAVWGLLIAALGFSLDAPIGNLCGSLALMVVLLGNSSVAQTLSGRVGAALGTLSFPIYLVHTLVILGLSSWAFVSLHAMGFSSSATLLLTLIVTLVGTSIFCIPLVMIESAWVPFLNVIVRQLIRSKPVEGSPKPLRTKTEG